MIEVNLIEQNKIEELIDIFNNTNQDILRQNIKRLIDSSEYKTRYLAKETGISIHTIYAYRKINKSCGISFEKAVKLCNVLGVNITELFREVDENDQQQWMV